MPCPILRLRLRALTGLLGVLVVSFATLATPGARAQTTTRVVDIPTRPGITLRALVLSPAEPKAAVILLAGGHGGLQISPDGSMGWGAGNFLVRTREEFSSQRLLVAVIDAPSDRQSYPYLTSHLRQHADHAVDLKAAMAWVRATANIPVWLVGTSMGTLSAAYGAIELQGAGGPDGIVLTSSILALRSGRPVPAMALDRIRVPVLVIHHRHDQCRSCLFSELPAMTAKLVNSTRLGVVPFEGGLSEGDPCEARAYHGYNGIETEVVKRIAEWISAKT